MDFYRLCMMNCELWIMDYYGIWITVSATNDKANSYQQNNCIVTGDAYKYGCQSSYFYPRHLW